MDQIFIWFGMAFIPVTSVLTALWITARNRAKRADAIVREVALARYLRGEHAPAPMPSSHVTDALDAIALEVERIAEGQRFTTKLLSERGREAAQGSNAPYRVNTPH